MHTGGTLNVSSSRMHRVLPGWEASPGARGEHAVADAAALPRLRDYLRMNEHRHTLLYVDKQSQLIYDTQLFDGYALVRPASPALYQFIEKISLSEFASRFEEFCGNADEVWLLRQSASL